MKEKKMEKAREQWMRMFDEIVRLREKQFALKKKEQKILLALRKLERKKFGWDLSNSSLLPTRKEMKKAPKEMRKKINNGLKERGLENHYKKK